MKLWRWDAKVDACASKCFSPRQSKHWWYWILFFVFVFVFFFFLSLAIIFRSLLPLSYSNTPNTFFSFPFISSSQTLLRHSFLWKAWGIYHIVWLVIIIWTTFLQYQFEYCMVFASEVFVLNIASFLVDCLWVLEAVLRALNS